MKALEGKIMKNIFSSSILASLLLLSACESNAGTGALVGGALGVGAGALVGGGGGALIGGAAGAVGGAVIGAAMDDHDRKNLNRNSPNTLGKIDRGEQLSVQDVKNMSKSGLNDEVIINQIKATNSVFNLTSNQIIDLKKSGVSQSVINYMIETGQ